MKNGVRLMTYGERFKKYKDQGLIRVEKPQEAKISNMFSEETSIEGIAANLGVTKERVYQVIKHMVERVEKGQRHLKFEQVITKKEIKPSSIGTLYSVWGLVRYLNLYRELNSEIIDTENLGKIVGLSKSVKVPVVNESKQI